MQAIEISTFGGPDVLKVTERPTPQPQDDEVLIRVAAAGVNRPDVVQRLGKYPPPPGASDLPGLEVAGEIVESRSANWQPGDKVCALLAGGGYAEYACAPAGQCLPIPKGLNMVQAAALPETVFTVWNNLFHLGGLGAGQTALVHGGASGIGTTAIQMSKAAGAHIIVTAGNEEKCDACRKLGADRAINYKTDDYETVLGENAVDIVLDMVGGDYVAKNLKVLKQGGRHVSIAFLNGPKAEINIPLIMQKRLTLTGSTLRPRPAIEKQALRDEIQKTVWPWIEAGKLKPVIYQIFSLEQAALAHAAIEADHIGKIVLEN
ncbi:MAG: NAD(P)H-quinone oxidoreductase [Rhodospirillales bacterium]|nr:NAD(P)H-quinone oxidoreductase [Rhodospirillales bacterium]